jgi:hypothetical protein
VGRDLRGDVGEPVARRVQQPVVASNRYGEAGHAVAAHLTLNDCRQAITSIAVGIGGQGAFSVVAASSWFQATARASLPRRNRQPQVLSWFHVMSCERPSAGVGPLTWSIF